MTGKGRIEDRGFTADKLHTDKAKQAFPEEPVQATGYLNTDKPSPGTAYRVPEDRDYTKDRQAFPWYPFKSIPRGRLHKHITPSPLHRVSQGTDYTKTDKSSPGTSLRAPGDRLHTGEPASPWSFP